MATALIMLSAVSSPAQDAVLGQLYGSGVHAFFSRDYVEAHELLTSAIDGGTRDPRPYYYRGLTYQKLGREEQAEVDFEKGADLESRDIDRLFNVGRSLERIHGQVRLDLERYRMDARLAARERAEKIYQQRYGAGQSPGLSEPPSPMDGVGDLPIDVADQPPFGPPTDFPPGMGPLDEGPIEPPIGPPSPPDMGSPFSEEPLGAPAPPPTDDPFSFPGIGPGVGGPTEVPAEPPLGMPMEDPLGGGGVEDETMPADPGALDPAAPTGGPFGGGLGPLSDMEPDPAGAPAPPVDDDPFGAFGAPAATPPAATPPAGTPAPPADDDPFGAFGAPATTPPATTPPATTPPAATPAPPAIDDPFGGADDAPPATMPAPIEDPFGQ
ncbi:MAG TPA: tetratricopeptide repeat protein [Thermoguttaceae bacterium]|nr:tetratricopeptide repeat protein [Thermoguttaceae bacterium]